MKGSLFMEAALSVGHIGINVTDLTRSIAFYQDIFDLEVLMQSNPPRKPYAFLGRGGKLMLTLWEQSTDRFNSTRPGLHHLAFSVPSIDDVKRAEAKIRKYDVRLYHDGIAKHGEDEHSGGVFFEDPDGTRLEVFAPTGADGYVAPTRGALTCGFF